jgi:hypothetical protein
MTSQSNPHLAIIAATTGDPIVNQHPMVASPFRNFVKVKFSRIFRSPTVEACSLSMVALENSYRHWFQRLDNPKSSLTRNFVLPNLS